MVSVASNLNQRRAQLATHSSRGAAPSSPTHPLPEPSSSSASQHSPPRQSAASPLSPRPQLDLPLIPDVLPIVPTLATTSPSNYGRINAENESNLGLLERLPGHRAYHSRIESSACMPLKGTRPSPQSGKSAQRHQGQTPMRWKQRKCAPVLLLVMPPELIDAILSHLSAQDLAIASATCKTLRKHAISDLHWQRLVQHNVPGQLVSQPGPCSSYHELYAAHSLVWFLPKYKIWFCDQGLMGKLIVARFDQRRGCIEGYQVLAISSQTTYEHWSADYRVIIHGFEPHVKLHLDKPVVQFRIRDRLDDAWFRSRPGANRFADEMPMALEERMGSMFSNFLLTRPLDPKTAEERLEADYPYDGIWPPPTIPARHHVSGARSGQGVVDLSPDDRPRSRSQASDQTFRIRQWIEMTGTPAPPGGIGLAGGIAGTMQAMVGLNSPGAPVLPMPGATSVHIGEEIITYSTLDPVLYTPTPTKPWRGIWVGDYSGHGCEFLLINQPDDPPATDVELGLVRDDGEGDEEWEKRRLEARVHRGRLEAIKLTGDPNVPRGEYTFVVDDLGPRGHVGVATEEPFVGVKAVRSKGHIAGTGFVQDKYIESQLLLVSTNRLAQYWVDFGHISFFERVNIGDFLVT